VTGGRAGGTGRDPIGRESNDNIVAFWRPSRDCRPATPDLAYSSPGSPNGAPEGMGEVVAPDRVRASTASAASCIWTCRGGRQGDGLKVDRALREKDSNVSLDANRRAARFAPVSRWTPAIA